MGYPEKSTEGSRRDSDLIKQLDGLDLYMLRYMSRGMSLSQAAVPLRLTPAAVMARWGRLVFRSGRNLGYRTSRGNAAMRLTKDGERFAAICNEALAVLERLELD